MEARIKALIAQENAAQYYQRAQRFAKHGVWVGAVREAVIACQERAAHHARIARKAMGFY